MLDLPGSLILSIKNGEDGGGWVGGGGGRLKGFLLKDQNLLSMTKVTKVISRGSLSGCLLSLEFKVYLEKFLLCPEM